MAYSLAQAADAVGMARSSILRAIKAGKISATRDENNEWQIEPAELHRVYPAPAAETSRTDELIAELRARLDDMRSALATAKADAETWRTAFEREQAQRALPAPSTNTQQQPAQPDAPPPTPRASVPTVAIGSRRAWWPWRRAG